VRPLICVSQCFAASLPGILDPLMASMLERLHKLNGRKHAPPETLKDLKVCKPSVFVLTSLAQACLSNFPLVLFVLQSSSIELFSAVISEQFITGLAGSDAARLHLILCLAGLVKASANPLIVFPDKDGFIVQIVNVLDALAQVNLRVLPSLPHALAAAGCCAASSVACGRSPVALAAAALLSQER